MNHTSPVSVLSLWPAWLLSALFPLPAVLLWHSEDGRFVALCCFFVSSTSLVVYAFRGGIPDSDALRTVEGMSRVQIWHNRLASIGLVLLFQWAVFSGLSLAINDAHDSITPVLALLSLIPSLCLPPYFMLALRKPLAAVVFTVFLVGSMKLLGCIVVVLIYGWDASEHGHTQMPWTRPNLLVWLFWFFTGVLCLGCYVSGKRRFSMKV